MRVTKITKRQCLKTFTVPEIGEITIQCINDSCDILYRGGKIAGFAGKPIEVCFTIEDKLICLDKNDIESVKNECAVS